ncbi:MAG TPA: ferritin-like domain-containing protein [Acidimicrobiia bacterium]|nr:ferritin-like domain-containing protein [Acidimicrobiia bacterium]
MEYVEIPEAGERDEVIAHVRANSEVAFTWDYGRSRPPLEKLYEKGKLSQWNATTDLDWSLEVDPTRPNLPDAQIPIFGTPIWDRMSEANRAELRHHMSAWILSQFLHGEQGALLCTAQIVETVPWIDAKYYAATQVMDEARHVETYARYLEEKIELAYPINRHLKALLDQIVSDSRWDMTYLGMQVLVEGLALAAFGFIRELADEPLLKELTRYVMADEARHVAFGTLALKEAYQEISEGERIEREDFCYEASVLMRDRFLAEEVWEAMGLPPEECRQAIHESELMQGFRRMLFSKIVPNLKKLGLLSDRIRPAYAELGVLEFEDLVDPETEALLAG